jgi:hypothetical protein
MSDSYSFLSKNFVLSEYKGTKKCEKEKWSFSHSRTRILHLHKIMYGAVISFPDLLYNIYGLVFHYMFF